MDEAKLAEIRARCDAAQVASLNARANVTFESDISEHLGLKVVELLAHAPKDIPFLLATIEHLRHRDETDNRVGENFAEQLREARARIAELEASVEPVERWQPIATAPKDGTVIVIGRDMGVWGFVRAFGYWVDHRGIAGWIPTGPASDPPGVLGLADPTHWLDITPTTTGGGA